MADVLIVCVREDEPQAKALAEMFEAAGFSIGGAPSSDGALRSSGAGLVVWSQASIRSRPFLDAAQRVINADKAVVASLIEPPPPSSIGDSPVFDLSRWDGDPNDPSLDPLFFAIDRMVNSARAAVGAGSATAEPAVYEPPPPRPAPRPEPRPAPRAEPQPSYGRGGPSGDQLGSEAEHWRAIRDSRNPADFMDYLGRYGPEGAFAEVAELRLKQLTSRGDARPSTSPGLAPTRTPSRPPVTPPSLRAPPQRADGPPPQRRLDPPPQRRADPPRRIERNYDRNDVRDPPKGEGGALRTFILIALLGGAAVLGGLYFGGGLPSLPGSAPSEQTSEVGAPPSAPLDEPAEALDQPVGVPIDEATTPSRPVQAAARTPARETPARDTTRRAETDTPPPAPTMSWTPPTQVASNNSSGGPVSLSPGSSPPASSGSNVSTLPVAPPPVTTQTQPASIATPPRPTRVATVSWAQRPSARRIAELYPARALREGVGGRVALDCRVLGGGAVSCSVASESPAGLGFGRAALTAASSYRANPTMSDGSTSSGATARIVVQFQAPAQQ